MGLGITHLFDLHVPSESLDMIPVRVGVRVGLQLRLGLGFVTVGQLVYLMFRVS